MKAKKVIEIQTEDYIEEQYILEKFPEALWFNFSGKIIFYLPEEFEDEIKNEIEEFERRKND